MTCAPAPGAHAGGGSGLGEAPHAVDAVSCAVASLLVLGPEVDRLGLALAGPRQHQGQQQQLLKLEAEAVDDAAGLGAQLLVGGQRP